jgi:hypothetical protein
MKVPDDGSSRGVRTRRGLGLFSCVLALGCASPDHGGQPGEGGVRDTGGVDGPMATPADGPVDELRRDDAGDAQDAAMEQRPPAPDAERDPMMDPIANPAACPATDPEMDQLCPMPTLTCKYGSDPACRSRWVCDPAGHWFQNFARRDCPGDCPATAPAVGGVPEPVAMPPRPLDRVADRQAGLRNEQRPLPRRPPHVFFFVPAEHARPELRLPAWIPM